MFRRGIDNMSNFTTYGTKVFVTDTSTAKSLARAYSWLTGLAIALVAGPTMAQTNGGAEGPTLTVDEAIERALEREALTQLHDAEQRATEADVKAAGAWPNPGFSFDLEQPDPPETDNVERESFFVLEQAFPISGRLGLERQSARRSAEATDFELESRRLEIAADVERQFYELLRLRESLELQEQWLKRLRDTQEIVQSQMSAGEASKFDVLEIEREIGAAQADLQSMRATFHRKRREFAVLVGIDGRKSIQLEGELTTDAELPPEEKLGELISERPDVRALRARAEAARAQSKAAGRSWIPEPALRGGYKLTNPPGESGNGDTFGGMLLGMSFPLPVLAPGTAGRERAEAERIRYASRADLIVQRARAQTQGLHREARTLRETAQTFRNETVPKSKTLVDTASSAYKRGNIGILELLNAHRGLLEARKRALELELQATLRRIELERQLGALLTRPSSSE